MERLFSADQDQPAAFSGQSVAADPLLGDATSRDWAVRSTGPLPRDVSDAKVGCAHRRCRGMCTAAFPGPEGRAAPAGCCGLPSITRPVLAAERAGASA
jgi:hypothetical protein